MKLLHAFLALTLTVLTVRPAQACGLTATCSDVGASLSGDVIFEGLRVSWDSDEANPAVGFYRVLRYPSGSPGMVRQIGSDVGSYTDCSFHGYTLDDTSVTSGSWVYVVQTWPAVGNSPTCAFDLPVTIP